MAPCKIVAYSTLSVLVGRVRRLEDKSGPTSAYVRFCAILYEGIYTVFIQIPVVGMCTCGTVILRTDERDM